MKKAFLVFSLLCVSVFVGCEKGGKVGSTVHQGPGGISKTNHYYNPNTNTHHFHHQKFANQSDYQNSQVMEAVGNCLWSLINGTP